MNYDISESQSWQQAAVMSSWQLGQLSSIWRWGSCRGQPPGQASWKSCDWGRGRSPAGGAVGLRAQSPDSLSAHLTGRITLRPRITIYYQYFEVASPEFTRIYCLVLFVSVWTMDWPRIIGEGLMDWDPGLISWIMVSLGAYAKQTRETTDSPLPLSVCWGVQQTERRI